MAPIWGADRELRKSNFRILRAQILSEVRSGNFGTSTNSTVGNVWYIRLVITGGRGVRCERNCWWDVAWVTNRSSWFVVRNGGDVSISCSVRWEHSQCCLFIWVLESCVTVFWTGGQIWSQLDVNRTFSPSTFVLYAKLRPSSLRNFRLF